MSDQDEVSGGAADTTIGQDASAESSAAATTEGAVMLTSKKTTAGKKAAKKRISKKAPKTAAVAARNVTVSFDSLAPAAVSELRLAPNGVRRDAKNRYVTIEFTNGSLLRLFPVGYQPKQVQKVSDLVVSWLKQRL